MKRLICFVLAVAMILLMLPALALACGGGCMSVTALDVGGMGIAPGVVAVAPRLDTATFEGLQPEPARPGITSAVHFIMTSTLIETASAGHIGLASGKVYEQWSYKVASATFAMIGGVGPLASGKPHTA